MMILCSDLLVEMFRSLLVRSGI